ncbi:MAG: fumarylacetoacetate hydrolase family protein [Gammaproteobacteria bacterium]|nr:fumarylacetoacetate hydrolase family protein [Gammaproteobacteria bacterium]
MMKLASVRYGSRDRLGVLKDDGAITLLDAFDSMRDLIRSGEDPSRFESRTTVPACEVDWRPPIRHPGKICCVAMNNSASNARKISAPDHPAYFLKPSSCLVGHRHPIRVRPYYGSVHPEPELAVVIGRRMKDVDAADAPGYVFGYTIMNDVTGNGMRAEDMFHYWALYANPARPGELLRREQHLSYAARYKGTDTFGCLGPVIATADGIPDPDDLDVTCRVGGETIAEDSTRYYNYKVAEILSFLSQFQTLEPGDIVSCGTAFRPSEKRTSIHHANFQSVGGPVEVTIAGIGTLVNPVEIEERPIGKWRLP